MQDSQTYTETADNTRRGNRVAVVVVAVALAVAVGATLAYLSSSSFVVTNTFNRQNVTVSLSETTGNEYDILPGTSQAKDPKVTVHASVDAYVYVIVTDLTGEDVSYHLDSGWTALSLESLTLKVLGSGDDAISIEDGERKSVYFREVGASSSDQDFQVLLQNQVTYPATLQGSEEDKVSLSFQAYAIQKEPFNDPVAAWNQAVPTGGGDAGAPRASIMSAAIPPDGINTATFEIGSRSLPTLEIMPTYALTFALTENPTTNETYKDWNADFVVSFDQDMPGTNMFDVPKPADDKVSFGKILFFGSYGDNSSYTNVPLALMRDVSAGEEYRLLYDTAGISITYAELKTRGVNPFRCGVTVKDTDDTFYTKTNGEKGAKAIYPNGLEALEQDVKMTLKLKLYSRDGTQSVTCAQKTYVLPAG